MWCNLCCTWSSFVNLHKNSVPQSCVLKCDKDNVDDRFNLKRNKIQNKLYKLLFQGYVPFVGKSETHSYAVSAVSMSVFYFSLKSIHHLCFCIVLSLYNQILIYLMNNAGCMFSFSVHNSSPLNEMYKG